MKIEEKTNAIETGGLGASGSFSIKTTAAAFQMLSSGLYSNKIRAVVRELSSNAVDAHTMVQNHERPIEVKLPNNLDSQFYVKDFGPGLSDNAIMNMYTRYFDSSKQASNDFIGGFGVGSKSPFAYTDAFTVESRHDGMRRLYTAFIGEENTPQIAQIGTFPMEEGETTGLTVSMPVKPQDFNSFEREAMDLFQWFDVKPTLLGTSRLVTTPSTTQASPGISWRQNAAYGESILIRMGQVVYSVDKYRESAPEEVQRAIRGLQRFKPLLEVPIGSMSVAASREEVAYDKNTKEYLSKRLPEAYSLAMRDVVQKLQSMDLTEHDGRKQAYDFLQEYGLHQFVSDAKADEMVAAKRQMPDLNHLLREQGISADQFLPILQGLEEPTAEQKKVVQALMPNTREKLETWVSSNYYRLDSGHLHRPVHLLEIDMPLNNIYAERARKAWYLKSPAGIKTIVLRPTPGSDNALYAKTRDEMIANWGLTKAPVTKLSEMLTPEDLVKYQKTQGLQSVPASTFFSGRPSICTSDLKSFYYVEKDAFDRFVVPEGWDTKKFAKLVETMQENAAVSKAFLKDMGADQATLSRVYAIASTDIEKAKAFPGARSLLSVLEAGLDKTEFRAHWDTLPVQREEKPIRAALLMQSNHYNTSSAGKKVVEELSNTQLGQALLWLKTIPEWTYGDNDKRPDVVQYVVLGGLLSDASQTTNPLPGKFFDATIVSEKIAQYYPLVSGAMREHTYSMPAEYGQELVQYIAWKDSQAKAPFLEGVTKLPTLGAGLDNTLASDELSL